jgi:hypothetical protein
VSCKQHVGVQEHVGVREHVGVTLKEHVGVQEHARVNLKVFLPQFPGPLSRTIALTNPKPLGV